MCSLFGIPKPELNQIKHQFISDNILMFTLYCSVTVQKYCLEPWFWYIRYLYRKEIIHVCQ